MSKMKTVLLVVFIISLLFFPLKMKAEAQFRRSIARDFSTSQPSPSRLIATDREVVEFLDSYIERYTKKDIDGFLRLFSLKAVQNQKDGLPGIREIYSNFFDQTQTLRCRFEEQRIEIYDNAVEIKARYEVEQIKKLSGERKFLRGSIRWVLIKEDGLLKILSLDYIHQ
ncbi:MAG TPA: nuclear transport factor 2 family protein [Thermodesulfobacteriota bacterium]|nr:nuclear transport factor 2 family protein [Thermodesulfobacteriota bacterium]